MKKIKRSLFAVVAVAMVMTLCPMITGCSSSNSEETAVPTAAAATGTYIGHDNDGVQEFLGIRYGNFAPWQPATDVETTTDDEIEAADWGKNCIQPYDETETASQDPCSQDCLFLNVWTKDTTTTDKPVIMFIHGGSYIWGGTSDPLYNGKNFVKNLPDGEDCVFVTINYRLSLFGGLDLTSLDGYTDDYKYSTELAKLDQTQALKWVNENIDAFGGDVDNVTIMGHSSGGAAVQMLYTSEDSNQYFNRAIQCSGVQTCTAMSEKQYAERSEQILDILGVKSIDELTALTDEEVQDKMTKLNENVDGFGNVVADGEVISKTWWEDLENGSAKDIDLMLGAVNGEEDWDSVDWDNGVSDPVEDYQPEYDLMMDNFETYKDTYGRINAESVTDAYMAQAESEGQSKPMAINSLHNDINSAYVNTLIADIQSQYNPNTYVYYWEYAPDKDEVVEYNGDAASVSPWNRALHTMSVNFIFGNPLGYEAQTGDPEKMDMNLSAQMQSAIYNFAKSGDPNNDLISEWKAYSADDPETMVIGLDKSWTSQKDYRASLLNILAPIKPNGTN